MGQQILRTALLAGALLAGAPSAYADSFVNGNFETGDLSGWTQGGGYWRGGWPINPSTYQPGGSHYNASGIADSVVTPGLDPNTNNNLNRVYSGNYSARINNDSRNESVSTLSQTVNNYTDSHIYFAWAAVLEGSHYQDDSDNFTLTLTDLTRSLTLYDVSYSSASAENTSLFHQSSTGWFYTDWQVQDLDVSAYSGDDFNLTLLAADCPYGAHAGYVYLDGFGAVTPPTSTVPEPAALALMAFGLIGLGGTRKRASR